MKLHALVRFSILHSLATTLSALAQTPVNGQIFSRGLAIINAPAINSEHNSPGTLPISIEVSGNGKVDFAAFMPDSGLKTAYEEINIYLVSSQTDTNLTVSVGPQPLTDESGTVRHLNWQIPACIKAGKYNMTFYETSRLEGEDVFAITPIPITINNPSFSGDCSSIQNVVEDQPQPDRAPSVNPFLPEGFSTPTLTMSEGREWPTATGPTMTTVTAVIESPTVLTEGGATKTSTMTWATTATMRPEDMSIFVAVNAGSQIAAPALVLWTMSWILVASLF